MWKESSGTCHRLVMCISCDSHVIFVVNVQKEDPFWEPTDVDVQIGSVHVYLQSLTYMVN